VSAPREIAGRFVLHAEVAAGGMGRVFRAYDKARTAQVAVKLLRTDVPIDPTRFEREALMLSAFRHPHIVGYVAHGIHEGARWLAMDWVEGRTLAHRLDTRGLDVGESLRLAAAVARALGEAHRHGVLHRDLKPSNLVLEHDDVARVKLVDFGVARFIADPVALTRTGVAMGTPGYMAPEQARGQRDVDGRADLFALGTILYECLTGTAAFAGQNATAVMCKIILLDPVPLRVGCPEVPAELERVLSAMLAKDPARRPADGDSVAEALERVAAPAGPRRRRVRGGAAARVGETPTLADAARTGPQFATLAVMVAGAADRRGVRGLLDERAVGHLSGLLESFGAGVEVLLDGTVVGVIAGTEAAEAAERAVLAGIAARAAAPGADVVVAAGDAASSAERAAAVLGAAALEVLRGGGSGGGIGVRVDESVLAWLPEGQGLTVERGSGGAVWVRAG
jgi:hypothetical protein